MGLSPELQLLQEREATYSADPTIIGEKLANKTLIMVGGPTKVGKTTLIRRAIDILPNAAAAPSVTDRQRKEGDPSDYLTATEGVTRHGLTSAIEKRTLVNYAIHPAGNIYATDLDSYPADFNFLPTIMNETVIEQLRHAGFKKAAIAYILMSENAYLQTVGNDSFNGKRAARMEEAISSLEYAKEHVKDISFIHNRLGQDRLEFAAKDLAFVGYGAISGEDKTKSLELIDGMLAAAKKLAQ